MDNKFYGIGVGVGDPDQITLKAIKTLKKLDVVNIDLLKQTGAHTRSKKRYGEYSLFNS